MEMKQLLVENATTEDFLRVKETFEKCIQALIPEINRFIYIREEKFEALTSYVKKLVTDELIASGEFVVEDTIKSLDPKDFIVSSTTNSPDAINSSVTIFFTLEKRSSKL